MDALALRADERRDKLRKASGRDVYKRQALCMIAPELPFELKFIELTEQEESLQIGPYAVSYTHLGYLFPGRMSAFLAIMASTIPITPQISPIGVFFPLTREKGR